MNPAEKQSRTPLIVINELEQSGDLQILVKAGFCNVKAVTHLQIYRDVDAKVRSGTPKSEAVDSTAESFEVCNRTVFRILRSMQDFEK